MRDLTVTERRIDALTPRVSNPRTHSKAQIRQIADSIETFGFTNPVLVDRDGGLIAGHGRVEAARLLGLDTVPTICLEDLSAAQVRAYVIADNKLAENAGWDRDLLAVEFQYLDTLDLDFDLTVTGFEAPEIDLLIGEAANRDETEPDADRATCGRSATTGSCAATRPTRRPTPPCSTATAPRWCSPTRRTTCRSTATSAGSGRSTTASSRWRRAR